MHVDEGAAAVLDEHWRKRTYNLDGTEEIRLERGPDVLDRAPAEQFVRENARVVDHDGGVVRFAGRGLDRFVARHIERQSHHPRVVPGPRRPR